MPTPTLATNCFACVRSGFVKLLWSSKTNKKCPVGDVSNIRMTRFLCMCEYSECVTYKLAQEMLFLLHIVFKEKPPS